MRRTGILLLLALSLASVSCCYTGNVGGGWDMFTNAIRNLGSEPLRGHDWMVLNFRFKGWAAQAWNETVKAAGEHHYSIDYEKGFKEGFRDYIECGGTGEPPAVPTLCYRTAIFRDPRGQQAVQDWYDGFRHGSQVARESGLRETILVPLASGVPPAQSPEATTPSGSASEPHAP